MNGKWALSAKDEGTLGLSDAFCPARHNQGPLLFLFIFLFSRSALPGVFLGQFLRILAVGLAGPRSTRLHGAARRRRQERGSPCKSQSCRRSGVFLALVCLLLNAATARRLSSCVAGLSSVASPAVMVVRPSTARAALPQQSPIGVKRGLQKENERKSPSATVIVRGLSNSRKTLSFCQCCFVSLLFSYQSSSSFFTQVCL